MKPLESNNTVRLRLPHKQFWTKGKCLRKVAPRSYEVEAEGKVYQRNRRHLLLTKETNSLPYNSSGDTSTATTEPGRNGKANASQKM